MQALLETIGNRSTLDGHCDQESVISTFHFALCGRPKLLQGALDVIDDAGVKEFRTQHTGRVVWKVRSSGGKEYTVSFPRRHSILCRYDDFSTGSHRILHLPKFF